MKYLVLIAIAVFAASAFVLFVRMRGSTDNSQPKPSQQTDVVKPQESKRLGYEESCEKLQALGYLNGGKIPPLPDHRPRYDDEEPLGVECFRSSLEDVDLQNLTLPRIFFGRSEVRKVSFADADLSGSTLCWNDFIEVDFTSCDLAGSDLRTSLFKNVKFVGANLRRVDLRRATIENCDFQDAFMEGLKLTHPQREAMHLSEQQVQDIDWQSTDGDEPGGG